MNIDIEYKLPILGKRMVSFRNDAGEIYSFLDEVGQISRLKNLNQLGIISDIIQTAHHPRYEYLFLLCYLVDRIKPNVKGYYPIGREVVDTLTGTELLKIWTLLLAIGHTPGSFPVEKAILKFLLRREEIKNQFLKRIKGQEIKKYALKLIDENRIYSFYHILSFSKIFRYRDNKKQKLLSGKCINYLSLYCLEKTKERYLKLRELFRKLRMFSYIILDSYYTGALTLTDLDGIVAKTFATISEPNVMHWLGV